MLSSPSSTRPIVRIWLLAVAALVFATVIVGGATRLTESGLSIVEWKPVTGAVPPFSEAQWQAEFDKYKTIPQWRELNRGMNLSEFKVIYLWEWVHRLLGRLIGAAFLLPFLFFLWRGWIASALRPQLWFIFALGALQGAVGWWMVASGLTDRISVSQYRLAFHLTLACVIYAALIFVARRMREAAPLAAASRQRCSAGVLTVLVLLQIYLGALVAGLDAGMTYNTWPLIDGALIPSADRLFFEQPWWRNLFENTLTVQFNHRMLAYLLVAATLLHWLDVSRRGAPREVLSGALAIVTATLAQAAIGVFTLIEQVPISLGLLHQGMAVAVLTLTVMQAERLGRASVGASRLAGQELTP
ncbi:MAG: COX15/CtaA family protein [Pseudorhodoplanes sp.]